jgi:hypothetical protein
MQIGHFNVKKMVQRQTPSFVGSICLKKSQPKIINSTGLEPVLAHFLTLPQNKEELI